MSFVYNAITFFPSRLLTLGNLGRDRVINAVGSLAESVIQSTANRLEAFPESHPRAMHVIEPMLFNLFKFSNNYSKLSTTLASTIIIITAISQTLLITNALVFPSLTIPVGIFAPLYTSFCILATMMLYEVVKSELEERYLNKSDDITKLGAAFFNLDAKSVSKLNAWASEQKIEGSSNWRAVRKKLVRFFLSPSISLDLQSSELRSLPDIFDAPVFQNLKYLNLQDNHLKNLPLSFMHLQSLKKLELSQNSTLKDLPEVLLQLPVDCRVNINNCNFSEDYLEELGNRLNNPTYNGPLISYSIGYDDPLISCMRSMRRLAENVEERIANIEERSLRASLLQLRYIVNEANGSIDENFLEGFRAPIFELIDRLDDTSLSRNEFEPIFSVEQSLRTLYNINEKPYRELTNLAEIPFLDQWLHKLFSTADFKGQSRKIFANRVIQYLEKANEDSSYRETLSATISDAVNTCGDRVTLSILKLGVTYQLSTVDAKDTKTIHYLLTKGTWALDLLHDIARNKISSMRFVDELEVYLAYPIKLKENLNLPIEVQEMLYSRCSGLTSEDLQLAENAVRAALNNEKEHVEFLISQPKWIDTLKLNYGERYRAIEEKKKKACEAADCNYVEIDLVHKEELKNLTREVISTFTTFNH